MIETARLDSGRPKAACVVAHQPRFETMAVMRALEEGSVHLCALPYFFRHEKPGFAPNLLAVGRED